MRFSAPRSVSPSPVRGKPRNSFGLADDSDSEDYRSDLESSFNTDSESDVASIASSSSNSSSTFDLVADINTLSLRPRHITRTPLEEREIEDTVASIRLRTRHHDPYEEWEQQTRKDAFQTARRDISTMQVYRHDERTRIQAEEEKMRAELHAKQANEIQIQTDRHRKFLQDSEDKLKEDWRLRDQQLWQRIEAVIKMEEDKLARRLEEERRVREEEERKRKEAELKRRLAEEKKLQEESDRQKVEEEKKQAEEERLRKEQEVEEAKQTLEKEEATLRSTLSFNLDDEDWRVARTNLHRLKTEPLKHVKSVKELKAEWSRLRRQIVPKIGQLTNDALAISQISQQLIEIMKPSNAPPHASAIYASLCSSVAKAILMQAETEVTAEKRSAGPLAQVAFNLLESLDLFPVIFFSKIVQRCGGWPIPIVVPMRDLDGKPWSSREEFTKVSGWRKSSSGEGVETVDGYSNRVSAIMRVYFNILKIRPTRKPLDSMFQLPRFWTWFARVMKDTRLLQDPVAPQLLYTGLDVLGLDAKDIWGQQWVKMLALIHEGITTGYENGKLIGGAASEAVAARTRVLVALEDIVNGRYGEQERINKPLQYHKPTHQF